ncbi:MaoC family dehydratase [Streptomyces sp. NPDC056716]|uniref:MaoC family dehydratase n=1 Tax=unclassified Streptomyces TaxID=2593676 RepID=UPI0036A9A189
MNTLIPQGYRQVGSGRFRELVGRGLAEFTAGEVIEHRPARTLTESEHVLLLALMGNPAPVHSDVTFCERTGRERVLVCGLVTLTVVLGMTVRSTSGLTSSNLALDEVRFEHPVHVGDTLRAQSTVVSARRSVSRPEHGVVTCRIEGFNQDGRRVLSCTRVFFVPADADAVRDHTGY